MPPIITKIRDAVGSTTGAITNLDGGRSNEVYGGVGDSPIDAGDST